MADNTWKVLDKPDGHRFVKGLLSIKADDGVAFGLKGTIVRRVSEQLEGSVVDAMVSVFADESARSLHMKACTVNKSVCITNAKNMPLHHPSANKHALTYNF